MKGDRKEKKPQEKKAMNKQYTFGDSRFKFVSDSNTEDKDRRARERERILERRVKNIVFFLFFFFTLVQKFYY